MMYQLKQEKICIKCFKIGFLMSNLFSTLFWGMHNLKEMITNIVAEMHNNL